MSFSLDFSSKRIQSLRHTAWVLALLAASQVLSGCVPLVIGSAVAGGTVVAADRRTTKAVIEDESIELQVGSLMREMIGERAHINVTSYNRKVLLSGEVPTQRDFETAQQVALGVDNVKTVVNELGLMSISTFSQRTSDAVITARVKTGLLDTRDLSSNAFKVVTEHGIVYLMGRVSAQEALLATEVAATATGVLKVVRLLDIIPPEELARMR